MLRLLLIILVFFSVSCNHYAEPDNNVYDREKICANVSKQLALSNTHTKLNSEQHQRLADTYVLNGCDK